ncbi:MAG TPA: class I SAM-dependent methyltransferase [Fluviicola sp.]|nr:class I SAM-dependent methyltransferase [Fluviicola sp.]
MEHTTAHICPACNNSQATTFLEVTDHFLSKEPFTLLKCNGCSLVYTTPRPSLERIGEYYKSEEYVSHSSTKKGLVNSIYNKVRNYTLNQKVKLVKRLVSGRDLLDVGAGTGHFLKRAQDNGFTVLGLEPDEDARKVAKEQNGVNLQTLDSLYELSPVSYDCITMWHVLEHVYNLQEDTRQIASLIKEKGVWIIAVPNHTSFDGNYYGAYWAAYDVPRHLYHFSPATIVPFIEQLGFQLEEQLPMKFDAYYVSMLSEKYKGGSLFNALRIGWLSNMRSKNGKCSSQIYVFRKK